MDVSIIYEDESVLVINKPTGLMVHGDGRSMENTLADWIMEKYPNVKEVGEPWVNTDGKTIYRPGIVHRLDRDTSGVMIIAKTQECYTYLKEQFQGRHVEKVYRAFAYGNMKENEGVIDKSIGKSNKDFRQWSAQPGARGQKREAITEFSVLARSIDKSVFYIELRPKTGRTHQLRVHMKALHHPIVCDPLYAPGRECIGGFTRLALHAYTLQITIKGKGKISFTAPLPELFVTMSNSFESENI